MKRGGRDRRGVAAPANGRLPTDGDSGDIGRVGGCWWRHGQRREGGGGVLDRSAPPRPEPPHGGRMGGVGPGAGWRPAAARRRPRRPPARPPPAPTVGGPTGNGRYRRGARVGDAPRRVPPVPPPSGGRAERRRRRPRRPSLPSWRLRAQARASGWILPSILGVGCLGVALPGRLDGGRAPGRDAADVRAPFAVASRDGGQRRFSRAGPLWTAAVPLGMLALFLVVAAATTAAPVELTTRWGCPRRLWSCGSWRRGALPDVASSACSKNSGDGQLLLTRTHNTHHSFGGGDPWRCVRVRGGDERPLGQGGPP